MSVLDRIIEFGAGIYEETGGVPSSIALPNAVHDRLKSECATRTKQTPSVVPGTLSCIDIETGHGVIRVFTAKPEALPDFPVSTSTLDWCPRCKDEDGLRPRHWMTRDKAAENGCKEGEP
jgi:hypothetical protein